MHRRTTVVVLAVALLVGACSSGGSDTARTTTTSGAPSTAAAGDSLSIVVTNDDGIGAPGIDVLVKALSAIPGVQVAVVAPLDNKSGTSDRSTSGPVDHAAAQTASGVAGTAVAGFPADAVTVALDDLGLTPDLVVSGVNQGQNLGPIAYVSGTVGAARTAARRGIPAVAASAGVGAGADYAAAAALVVAWIGDHRAALLAGTATTDTVTSFNVPDCALGGKPKKLLEVPLAATIPDGVDLTKSDCSVVPAKAPADDIAALIAGYAAETLVPLEEIEH
ncbi:MAG: 5'/3'-nucleotidase SurE [Acidimicrobiales bacterium]